MRTLMALLAVLAVPTVSKAQPADPGPVVAQAWARATTDLAQNGAAYLTVTSPTDDQLVGVASPVARTVELHRSIDDHGVMEMRPVTALPLPAGVAVQLAPGGYHAMLVGLTQPLHVGDHFALTLMFQHAGAVTTEVTVARAGARQAEETHAH